MIKWMSLAAGGIAGTLARYLLTGILQGWLGARFPYGTLVVNLIGCFLIGLLAFLSGHRFALSPDMQLLLITGFCGAFTTFSALILETSDLIQHGQSLRAFLYVAASLVLGFAFFRLGVCAAKFF